MATLVSHATQKTGHSERRFVEIKICRLTSDQESTKSLAYRQDQARLFNKVPQTSSLDMIRYEPYRGEADLEEIIKIVSADFSEAYSIWTFRYAVKA